MRTSRGDSAKIARQLVMHRGRSDRRIAQRNRTLVEGNHDVSIGTQAFGGCLLIFADNQFPAFVNACATASGKHGWGLTS